MRALVCRQYGEPDVLRIEDDWPAPALGPDDVRIAVATAGVSFAFILGIAGKHQNRPGLPYVPGGELTGTIIEVGANVTDRVPGQRVVALGSSGACAAEAVVPAATTWPVPAALDDGQALVAASIHASLHLLFDHLCRLQPGETLLVHGAGGGSGLGAVGIGKAMGARVIAVAGGPDKLVAARAGGADVTIDHRQDDFRDRVLALTDGRGADVIFDPVGGEVFERSLRCIAPGGRLIPYGFAGGTIPQIPANLLLVKNASAIGFYWGYYLGWAKQPPTEADRAALARTMETLMAWLAAGRLAAMPVHRFALADWVAACNLVSDRSIIGKAVLTL